MHELLKMMVEKEASDLHLMADTEACFRIHGEIVKHGNKLSASEVESLVKSVMSQLSLKNLEENWETDFSFEIAGVSRYRANVFKERGSIAAAFRTIPTKIRTFEELALPEVINTLCAKPRGLVLVTGPTGSGKSTTLAAMINSINESRKSHIITLEDPIEYMHHNKQSLVNQREIHIDTQSFHNALRAILRQDPDVVLIGEMRDKETISSALTVSETGHLTFATLHTNSAVQTINRIIEVFPPEEQQQIRTQLSFVLEGIISQQLLPTADGLGRVAALEVLVPNAAIRNLIREDKVHQIYSSMQSGQQQSGMVTMNQSLVNLVRAGKITAEVAISSSTVEEEVLRGLGRF